MQTTFSTKERYKVTGHRSLGCPISHKQIYRMSNLRLFINGLAKHTNVDSCHATHDPNSLDTLNQRILDHVFADRHKCVEYNNCVQQNGKDFGFIPLMSLEVYHSAPIAYDQLPNIIIAHKIVRQTGSPNFFVARIPIASQLKPQK